MSERESEHNADNDNSSRHRIVHEQNIRLFHQNINCLNFPAKLYHILETTSSDIIQWQANGVSFRINDHKRFEQEVIPKYFRRKLSCLWACISQELNCTPLTLFIFHRFSICLCSTSAQSLWLQSSQSW